MQRFFVLIMLLSEPDAVDKAGAVVATRALVPGVALLSMYGSQRFRYLIRTTDE